MTEDQIRDLFREMRDEPIPADSLARVRLGVTAGIRKRVFTPWRIAFALLAIGCILLVALLPRTTTPISKPAAPVVARRVDVPPAIPAAAPVVTHRRMRRAVKQARRVEKSPEPGGATVIRIETPDPEIVILLIGD